MSGRVLHRTPAPAPGTVAQPVDIEAFIDGRGVSWRLWLLAAVCFAVVAADGMDVAVLGFVAPAILRDWHLSRAAFGLVMGAAPLGLVAGALVAGPLADRLGRKPVLVGSVLLFGLFTVATSQAGSPGAMGLLRLFSGMGLGAAMPNVLTLISEYCPRHARSRVATIMFTGFNFGSAAIGLVAGYLIPRHGWRSVLLFASVVPLVMVPVLLWLLPESARLLQVRRAASTRIAAVLFRVTGHRFAAGQPFTAAEPPLLARTPVGTLFTRPYLATTMTLWVTCFMGLLLIYLLTSWLPTMIRDAGASISRASYVTAMFQFGGTLGAIAVGWAMDRGHPTRVVAAAYLGGGAGTVALSMLGAQTGLFVLMVFLAGGCISGAQTGLNAYAPACYPTAARSTGVSWMLGVGRVGSILGSSIGGVLLASGWGLTNVLRSLLVPAACAAAAILLGARAMGRSTTSSIAH